MNLIRKQQNFLPFVFDNFFRDTWDIMPAINNNHPATNVKESDKDFIIEFAIPGKSNDDFEVELDKNLLTIKSNGSVSENDYNYMQQQFNFSTFSKSYELPDSVDLNKIDSHYRNGMLTVILPKRKEFHTQPKRLISVKK
ncbi:MAG: Hsp20/alpha crystallin family protein [Flavobacteriaceae bacterium]|nr:MAG: Hsp20/alpha crystallin family protein [Cryomorphaceae bacterium]